MNMRLLYLAAIVVVLAATLLQSAAAMDYYQPEMSHTLPHKQQDILRMLAC